MKSILIHVVLCFSTDFSWDGMEMRKFTAVVEAVDEEEEDEEMMRRRW